MSSTRDFKSPGIFAENATTTIPPTPIQGVAYRDAISGADDTPNGWRFGTKVDSQDWNQVMYLITSIISSIDKKGVLGWSSAVNYDEPAICFGSDGQLYTWIQASGPANGGAQDPISSPAFWKTFTASANSPGDIKASAVNAVPDGWLKANGAAVSRTTYADLFAAIGTTYGAGNGTTTFNVPDLRGEFIRGLDEGRGVDPSRVMGSSQAGAIESHSHRDLFAFGGGAGGTPNPSTAYSKDYHATGTINFDGTGNGAGLTSGTTGGAETRPRNVAMIYLIKT